MVYMFLFGAVAITVRYWEETGDDVEGGARVEVRRAGEVIGEHHRPGAAGWRVGPVSEAGVWRSDLLSVINRPGNEPRFHHHPAFQDGDVGRRVFDPGLSADPVEWTIAKLADLPALLHAAGAADIIDQIDLEAVDRALPAIRSAILVCLDQVPRAPAAL
jgi:hypothetical protein